MAPENSFNIAEKVRRVCLESSLPENFAITERGVSFGYGNLVVDMRAFPIMAASGATTIFDVTHSLQLPASAGSNKDFSGGERQYAPVLARAAAATGYLDGFFLEVHPAPEKAMSDASTQIPLTQIDSLLRQIVSFWRYAQEEKREDQFFV